MTRRADDPAKSQIEELFSGRLRIWVPDSAYDTPGFTERWGDILRRSVICGVQERIEAGTYFCSKDSGHSGDCFERAIEPEGIEQTMERMQ